MADQPRLNSSSITLTYLVNIRVIIIVQVHSEEKIKYKFRVASFGLQVKKNTGNKFRQGGDFMVKFSHFILDMQ